MSRTAYIRGRIAYKQGSLTEAYNLFEFSARAIAVGKETYRTIISTSYQQGCIRLLQGDYNGALCAPIIGAPHVRGQPDGG